MGFYLLEYISGCQHHQTDLALLTPREAGDGRGRVPTGASVWPTGRDRQNGPVEAGGVASVLVG